MTYRPFLLGSICAAALALSASTVLADGIAGTLSGDYSNLSLSGISGSADDWGVSGALEGGTGFEQMKVELNAGYHNLSSGGLSIDNWDVGGNAFWAPGAGRLGINVAYRSLSGSGASVDLTNYGAFAEWWATNAITLAVKGGGLHLKASASYLGSGSTNGYYVGGNATGYVMPDLSLSGRIDYTDLGYGLHDTDYTARAEWLPWEDMPISISGGYTYSDISMTSTHGDTWFVALTYYYNEGGDMSLVDRQRSGTLGWSAAVNPVAAAF